MSAPVHAAIFLLLPNLVQFPINQPLNLKPACSANTFLHSYICTAVSAPVVPNMLHCSLFCKTSCNFQLFNPVFQFTCNQHTQHCKCKSACKTTLPTSPPPLHLQCQQPSFPIYCSLFFARSHAISHHPSTIL